MGRMFSATIYERKEETLVALCDVILPSIPSVGTHIRIPINETTPDASYLIFRVYVTVKPIYDHEPHTDSSDEGMIIVDVVAAGR